MITQILHRIIHVVVLHQLELPQCSQSSFVIYSLAFYVIVVFLSDIQWTWQDMFQFTTGKLTNIHSEMRCTYREELVMHKIEPVHVISNNLKF